MKSHCTPYLSTNRIHSGGLIIVLFLMIVFSNTVHGQLPYKQASVSACAVTSGTTGAFTPDFTAREVKGIVYLNWRQTGDTTNSVFIIERALPDEDYKIIGYRDGYPAPQKDVTLLYCYSDANPGTGTSTYRIRQFINNTYYCSQSITLNKEVDLIANRSCGY